MTPARELRLAVGIGLLGGVLLGAREGVVTLAANVFAEADRYAMAYLVAPVAVWCLLGSALMLGLWLVARPAGGARASTYAATLAAVGVLLALLPWVADSFMEMRATGVEPRLAVVTALAILAGALILTAGLVVGAAIARGAERWPRPFQMSLVAAAVVAVAAWGWTGHFLVGRLRPPDVSRAIATAGQAAPGAPNVLLVSIDTLRADEVGVYGSPHGNTPALDRLAAEGVTFERTISPAPWTLPAIASLMTGLYPRHHGAGGIANRHDPLGRTPLASGTPTLAETLAAQGYRTQAIVTNPYLLASSGLAAGYAGYENLTFLSEAMLAGGANAGQWLLDHLAPRLVVGDRGSEVSDRAVRWLNEVDGSRPFLLWVHYIDPHGPYGCDGASRHKSFRGDSVFGALTGRGTQLDVLSPSPARLRSGEIRLDEDGKRAMRRLYRAEVAEVDRQVGRVLSALEARDLRQNTVVIVVSDHGEEFWEHGGVEHGHTLYDEVLRVPLLVRWPGRLPAGRRVTSLASLVDVVPTIRDLLDLDHATATDGVSLVPAMRGTLLSRAVLSENLLFAEERVSVRTDGAKLVRWASGKEEVYDLAHDPTEQRDLAGREQPIESLRAELARVEGGIGTAVAAGSPTAMPVAALRALGYVQ